MFFLKVSLLLLFFTPPLAAFETKQDWELVKYKNGIKVYTRALVNSDYPEFRGETDIKANINELLAFINDGKHCPAWRYKCIKMLNLSDNYIYKLSSLPWPFSNRYTIMESKLHFDKQNNSYTIKLTNIKRSKLPLHILAQLPEQKETVQMRYSDGYWQLKPTSTKSSTIHITYQMHGDADVALPSGWAQLGIINSAFVTLSNLKKHFMLAK